jgi:molybdenum cofactor biosynthesis enzyme MoaA
MSSVPLAPPSVRFLLTSRCNFRCTFCHNEFQGDVKRGTEPRFDEHLVLALLDATSAAAPVRVKISGGEPLLRFRDVVQLLQLSAPPRVENRTLFTKTCRLQQMSACVQCEK